MGVRSLPTMPDGQRPSSEQSVSEDVIKKVALRFMRQYYKFRLRYDEQPVVAKYDLEGVGGIVADGYYSFKKADGKPFVATFEATSQASQTEVLFKPQHRVLFWDGLAVASLVALVFSAINHFYDFHQISEREFFMRAGMVLGIMALAFGVFYLIAKNFRRYRYIYAVEQFKRYHADEQWVVIASDVFSAGDGDSESFARRQHRRFQELREQCIINGFGLLKVDTNLDTKIVVTPSRQDIFMGKRKRVNFMSKEVAAKAQTVKEFGLKGVLSKLFPGMAKSKTDGVYRFRKNFFNQMLMTLGSFLLIGFMLMKEMELSDYQSVDQNEFRHDLAISQSNNVPEQTSVLGDSLFTTNTNRIEQEEFNDKIFTTIEDKSKKEKAKKKTAPKPEVKKSKPTVKTTEIYINNGQDEKAIAYDCSRFFNFETRKYIVEEGTYRDWKSAKRRLDVLRKNNLESAALLLACFSKNEEGYVIYLGLIYNSIEEASQKIESLRGAPESVLKDVENMKIRSIFPVRQ